MHDFGGSGRTILYVEDDPHFADLTVSHLERLLPAPEICREESVDDGLDRFDAIELDCVVSDYDLPRATGIDFLRSVREEDTKVPFILFTGKGSEEVASDAIAAGVTDYLQKRGATEQFELLANRIENAVEQYRAELAAERANGRRKRMLDRITDGYAALDRDLRIVEINAEAATFAGRPREELLGTAYEDLVHDEAGREVLATYKRALESGTHQSITTQSDVHPDRWVTDRVYPSEDGIFVYFQDITERVESQRQLQERTRQLEGVLNSVEAGLWMRDPDSRYILINQEYRQLFDIDEGLEVEGRTPEELVGKDLGSQFRENDRQAIEAGEPVELEERVGTEFGDRWYLTRITPLYDDDGELYATGGVSTDITDRKRIERELRVAKTQLDTAVEAGTIGTWTWWVEENRITTEAEFAPAFDGPPENGSNGVSLDRFLEEVHPDDRDRVRTELRHAAGEQSDCVVSFRALNGNGSARWIEVRGEARAAGERARRRVSGVLIERADGTKPP